MVRPRGANLGDDDDTLCWSNLQHLGETLSHYDDSLWKMIANSQWLLQRMENGTVGEAGYVGFGNEKRFLAGGVPGGVLGPISLCGQ